ncbi:Os12g0622850, partial [Oryza sativa Japonica Group]
ALRHTTASTPSHRHPSCRVFLLSPHRLRSRLLVPAVAKSRPPLHPGRTAFLVRFKHPALSSIGGKPPQAQESLGSKPYRR